MKNLLEKYGDLLENEPLSKHTTFKVGGEVKYFIYPFNEMCLFRIIDLCKKNGKNYKVLGKGSNILASDNFFDGVVICLDRYFKNFIFENDGTCFVQSGVSLVLLAAEACKLGLTGLEFASGIPATVGGALYMNAGAYKSDMSNVVEKIYVLVDSECKWLDVSEANYSYRTSYFQKRPDIIILGAKIKLEIGNHDEIKSLMDSRKKRRLESQPLDRPCAGSVFRNPDGNFAWKLIDDCGLRGKTIGGAQISEKHSNFIINSNNAKSKDILDLIEFVQDEIYKKYNVKLKTEVEKFNW